MATKARKSGVKQRRAPRKLSETDGFESLFQDQLRGQEQTASHHLATAQPAHVSTQGPLCGPFAFLEASDEQYRCGSSQRPKPSRALSCLAMTTPGSRGRRGLMSLH